NTLRLDCRLRTLSLQLTVASKHELNSRAARVFGLLFGCWVQISRRLVGQGAGRSTSWKISVRNRRLFMGLFTDPVIPAHTESPHPILLNRTRSLPTLFIRLQLNGNQM